MTTAQLIALLLREIVPAAAKIVELAKRPPDEIVTPETLARLDELAGKTAADYEKERQ